MVPHMLFYEVLMLSHQLAYDFIPLLLFRIVSFESIFEICPFFCGEKNWGKHLTRSS